MASGVLSGCSPHADNCVFCVVMWLQLLQSWKELVIALLPVVTIRSTWIHTTPDQSVSLLLVFQIRVQCYLLCNQSKLTVSFQTIVSAAHA